MVIIKKTVAKGATAKKEKKEKPIFPEKTVKASPRNKITIKKLSKPAQAEKDPEEIQEKAPVISPELGTESVDIGEDEKALFAKGLKLKYIEAIGRRKTATARVRLFTQGNKEIMVNGKLFTEYFSLVEWQRIVEDPLRKLNCMNKFGISVKTRGGGLSGQAEAVRHGISRALVALNPYFKKRLKKSGYLTRDSRMRERKKSGLKRARRAPQWSKR